MQMVEIHHYRIGIDLCTTRSFWGRTLMYCQLWANTLFFLDTSVILFMGTELLL